MAEPGMAVTAQVIPQNVRDWSSGLFGCCEDVASCKYMYQHVHTVLCNMNTESETDILPIYFKC